MKKLKFLGREIPVLLVAMLAMAGLATAALVPYLSNAVSGSAEVDSPFTVYLYNDGTWVETGTVTYDTLYGGDTLEARGRVVNHLDKEVTRDEAAVVITISSSLGDIADGEITQIRMKDLYSGADESTVPWQPLDSSAWQVINGDIVIAYGLLAGPNHDVQYPMEMDVALNVHPDTVYTMSVEVDYVPDLDSNITVLS